MMDILKNILFILIILVSTGCDNLFFDQTPETEPLEVYDAFVHEMTTKSPFLQYISMDVDSLFDEHRSQIKENPTGKQLIRSLTESLNILKDAHTTLTYDLPNDKMFVGYNNWRTKYPENKLSDISHYFKNYSVIGAERIEYGRLKGENIGYLKLNTLSLGFLIRDVRTILKSFEDTDGLILDIRSAANRYYNYSDYNGVGSLIKQLNDSSGVFLYRRIREPANEVNFSEWYGFNISSPNNSSFVYSNPIAVLTNRQTKDVAEFLAAGVRTNPLATIIGDTTAGFIGTPDFTHLSGKWYMEVSIEEFKLPENYLDSSHRFQGIPPDIVVEISPADSSAGVDTILERAIEELSE